MTITKAQKEALKKAREKIADLLFNDDSKPYREKSTFGEMADSILSILKDFRVPGEKLKDKEMITAMVSKTWIELSEIDQARVIRDAQYDAFPTIEEVSR